MLTRRKKRLIKSQSTMALMVSRGYDSKFEKEVEKEREREQVQVQEGVAPSTLARLGAVIQQREQFITRNDNTNKRRRHSSDEVVLCRTRRKMHQKEKENCETLNDYREDSEVEEEAELLRNSAFVEEEKDSDESDEQEGVEDDDNDISGDENSEDSNEDSNNEAEAELRKMLKRVYNVFNRHSEIYFGVDKDIGDLPKKRVSKASQRLNDVLPSAADRIVLGRTYQNNGTSSNSSGSNNSNEHRNSKNLRSAGYGEITRGSFSKLLRLMQTKVPSELRLDQTSSFLDIGSGFGKCVVHAKVMVNVARSVGLEYVKKRHEIANEAFKWLKKHNKKSTGSNQNISSSSEEVPLLNLSGVELKNADATKKRKGFNKFTHIYCFDYVFSQDTREKLARLLAKTDFKLLACCTNPKRIAAAGCPNLQLIHKFTIRTTGNQNFTMYLYRKPPS